MLYLDAYGHRIVAAKDIPAGTRIVSCPFDLVITPESSRKAIFNVLRDASNLDEATAHWTEREWIATYLSLHWVAENHER